MKRIALAALLLLACSLFAATPAVTVKGQIIDTYCYVANGEQGEDHAAHCGMGCVKNGVPVGLLEGKKVYILLGSGEGKGVPQELKEKVGKTVTITGHAYTTGGSNFLTVESFK